MRPRKTMWRWRPASRLSPVHGSLAQTRTRSTVTAVLDPVEHCAAGDALGAGAVVDARYRIERRLGRGGMGAVYRARHLKVGRTVAIKVLSPELVAMPDVRRRFESEARAASAAGHPGIVEVFDAGTLADGRPYLVMEELQGHELTEEIDPEHPMHPRRAARILRDVARAVAAAHEVGVVHRNLKPENVFVRDDPDSGEPRVKVLDFGIAHATAPDQPRLTMPGSSMGTPEHMCPEQARGDPPTPRFDVYGLGSVLFELLASGPPFVGRTPLDTIVLKETEVAPPLTERRPDAPEVLARLVAACLERDPALRPASAREVADTLDAWLEAEPEAPAETTTSRGSGRGILWWAASGLVLVGAIAMVVATLADGAPAPAPVGTGLGRIADVSARAAVHEKSWPIPAVALAAPTVDETDPNRRRPRAVDDRGQSIGTPPAASLSRRIRAPSEGEPGRVRPSPAPGQRRARAPGLDGRAPPRQTQRVLAVAHGSSQTSGASLHGAGTVRPLHRPRAGLERPADPALRQALPAAPGSRWMIASPGRTTLAIALALSLASPSASAAAPAARHRRASDRADAGDRLRASITTDTSDVGAAGPVIHRRIAERGDVVLRKAEVLPGAEDDPVIGVTVHELSGEQPGFTFEIALAKSGHHEQVDCTLCTETELVERVEARLTALVEELETEHAREVAAEAASQPDPTSAPSPPPPDRPRRGLGVMGKTGIGLAAGGVAALAVGAGLAFSPDRPRKSDPLYATETRRPGLGVMAGGGALLLVGIVLLAIDRGRANHRTSAAPLWGPRTAGLVIRGRF